MENHDQPTDATPLESLPPEGAQETEHIESLPMVRYAFVMHGHLSNGASITIKGNVYAGKGMYYQAQTHALDTILKDIPTFKLDETAPVGLRMYLRKKYLLPKAPPPPDDPPVPQP